jgi:hypothetical protein
MPAADAPFNQKVRDIAGDNDESRLFIFRGTTYYERRSRAGLDGIPVHEVWKLTTSAPVRECVFNAVTYVASK